MEIPELPSFIRIRCSAQEKRFLKFTYSTYPFSTCVSVWFCASAHVRFHYINIFTFAFRILCTNSNICCLKEAYILVHWASVCTWGGSGGVCVFHVGGISPEPFAMRASFFIHPALTAQRHPSGCSHHTRNSTTVCMWICTRAKVCSCDAHDCCTVWALTQTA